MVHSRAKVMEHIHWVLLPGVRHSWGRAGLRWAPPVGGLNMWQGHTWLQAKEQGMSCGACCTQTLPSEYTL